MFKLVLTLSNTHQISHKVTNEEDALDLYFTIQHAMSAGTEEQTPAVLTLGDSLLVRPGAVVSCELKGPRTQ